MHPVVKSIVERIVSNRIKEGDNPDAVFKAVESEVDGCKVYAVVLDGRTVTKPLCLSDALKQIVEIESGHENRKSSIVHIPSKTVDVSFMIGAYEFYASHGFLGVVMAAEDAPNDPPAGWMEGPANWNIVEIEQNL